MITARPGTNATSIPILTEVLELPQQLATPVPVVPQELVPQHLIPEPVTPPPPEPLVMRTRGAGGSAAFSTRLVDAAGLSEHAVQETPAGEPAATGSLADATVEATAPVDVPAASVQMPAPAAAANPSTVPPSAAVPSPAAGSSTVTSINVAAARAGSTLSMVPPAPPAPALDLDALAERLHANVLADLQERIEPVLHARVMQRLEPVLRTALADISLALQEEITSLVDEAVQKALIQHVTNQE